jgi:hypothetical protein
MPFTRSALASRSSLNLTEHTAAHSIDRNAIPARGMGRNADHNP